MEEPILFYDGDCGLCHRAVTFILARDRLGRFRFAPLGGGTWSERVAVPRASLPDSLVLLEGDRLLTRSEAVLSLLAGLGGGWRFLGCLGHLFPRRARDLAYDAIARRRGRFFPAPVTVCPRIPTGLGSRFLP
jgi:predicted DCC family thiol-disulfide oxidoreductase YuxK